MTKKKADDTPILEMLFEIFRNHGYEGSTIELITEVTGFSRSSLYHRFPAGKTDMIEAVASYVSNRLHREIIYPLLNRIETPEKRFSGMLFSVNRFYDNGRKKCLYNSLALDTNVSIAVSKIIITDYNAWISALVKLCEECNISTRTARIRSEQFLSAVEGAIIIQHLTNNNQFFINSLKYQQEIFFHKDLQY